MIMISADRAATEPLTLQAVEELLAEFGFEHVRLESQVVAAMDSGHGPVELEVWALHAGWSLQLRGRGWSISATPTSAQQIRKLLVDHGCRRGERAVGRG